MKIQLLPKNEKPKVPNDLKNKAQGPKYPYKDGEPSINSMSENMNKVVMYGEFDHTRYSGSSFAASNAPSDISNLTQSTQNTQYSSHSQMSGKTNNSHMSKMSNKTNVSVKKKKHIKRNNNR
eukprot:765288_1